MEVSRGGTGTYGRQVVEYKCHEFLIVLRREIMGLCVLTRLN